MKYSCGELAIYEVLDQEVVFLDLETGEHFVTTGVGAHIVEQLFAQKDTEEVVCELAEYYGVDRAAVRSDLLELVEVLLARGLIRADSQ